MRGVLLLRAIEVDLLGEISTHLHLFLGFESGSDKNERDSGGYNLEYKTSHPHLTSTSSGERKRSINICSMPSDTTSNLKDRDRQTLKVQK